MAADNQGKWEYLLFRILYMILFWLLSRLAWVLVGIFAVVQLIFVVIRSERQPDLLRFSSSTVLFARQCGDYLTFQSEYKPFPFNDWPPSEAPGSSEDRP
ncbi:DUF4389 domain-containing protein [Natronospirillum operosum]|uniref:DUF4389 domain-containing protein n=1 Tax=Natronospirillum operosum TaxID=2759953 RepID=A0A4Z0WJG2_9GAMM|nr:DUF4389 domain-containing protein [Natronospirillum operosum]TGG95947.1 DUF4389 domain-containing protein [Natronospirillum operosum]